MTSLDLSSYHEFNFSASSDTEYSCSYKIKDKECRNQACMGDLKTTPTLAMSFRYPERFKDFYKFIVDEEISPWRNILKDRTQLSIKNKLLHGIVFYDTDADSRSIVNFCIASRVMAESYSSYGGHYNKPVDLDFFLERGHTYPEAFFLCLFLDKRGIYAQYGVNHSPLDLTKSEGSWNNITYSQFSLEKFKNGDIPVYGERSLRKSSNYNPCSKIWMKPSNFRSHNELNDFIKDLSRKSLEDKIETLLTTFA